MNITFNQATEAADFLSAYGSPTIGVIQGTGLSKFAGQLVNRFAINYADIPHMPESTVDTHDPVCTIGNIGDKTVIAFSGRFHYYEGHEMDAVTFPVRVMQLLGVKHLLMSNAAGGLTPLYTEGDIVIVNDHINTFPANPLRGSHDPRLGVQFPDLSNAYAKDVRSILRSACESQAVNPQEGIYLGLQGPSLETPAEYKLYRSMGGDLIGMSTVSEVIVANQAGIKVGVLSVVTNTYDPNRITETTLEEVVEVVEDIQEILIKVIVEAIHLL